MEVTYSLENRFHNPDPQLHGLTLGMIAVPSGGFWAAEIAPSSVLSYPLSSVLSVPPCRLFLLRLNFEYAWML
jgi:hypothetical protein